MGRHLPDPGNSGPDDYTEELTADEIGELLERFRTERPPLAPPGGWTGVNDGPRP